MRKIYIEPDDWREIYKISFYSPAHGYVAFPYEIGFTSDSGRTFTKKTINEFTNIDYGGYTDIHYPFIARGVKAFSQNSIIVWGQFNIAPAILYSDNGGNTFKLVYHSPQMQVSDYYGMTDMVFPQNGNIGYAVDAQKVLKTTDKGRTWSPVRDAAGMNFEIVAVDANTVFLMSTDRGVLYKTVDGGINWQFMLKPSGYITGFYFLTPLKGWVSIDGNIYYTSNGGTNWTQKNKAGITSFYGEKMQFLNDSTGYALLGNSNPFQVYKTTDSGRIWEPIARDNDFTYLNFGHNDLHFWNHSQLWAGGGHGFLELNSNPQGPPLPKAYFTIDTTNMFVNNMVALKNYSKSHYQIKWYVNGVFAGSGYHSSYLHNIYLAEDTVTLIVSNGVHSDTVTQYYQFNAVPYPAPVVESYSPGTGTNGTVVTITGNYFSRVSSVSFGGIPATSFTVNSLTQITAVVGPGANGNVAVTTQTGTGSRPGFITFPPPKIVSISPTSGAVGSVVTIYGNNFNSTPENNIVHFGSIKARVVAASSNQLSVVVPAGIMYAPLTVNVNKHVAFSSQYFNVTFPGTCGISPYDFAPAKPVVEGNDTNDDIGIGDFNSDGKNDIVTTGFGNISVFRNISETGSINFIKDLHYPSLPYVYLGKIAVGDLDGDGKPEMVITNKTKNNLQVYKNTSTPQKISFAPKIELLASNEPFAVTISDLDADGKADIVIGNHNSNELENSISIFRNITIDGNIAFSEKIEIVCGQLPKGVHAGDFDGDGKTDLLVADRVATQHDGDYYSIFRNTSDIGSISFDTLQKIPHLLGGANEAALGDLDGDGKLDITHVYKYMGGLTNAIMSYRNTSVPGKISFATPVSSYTGQWGQHAALGDFDGDNKIDMFISKSINDGFGANLFKNSGSPGNIVFIPKLERYWNLSGYHKGVIADLDGDSKPDILTGAVVYRNTFNERGAWAGKDTTTCSGQNVVLGGDGIREYTFSWSSSSGNFTSAASKPIVNPTATTSYYLTVTNKEGCVIYDTIHVTVGGPPPVVNAGPNPIACIGKPVQIGTVAIAPNQYSWRSIPEGFHSTEANPTVMPTIEETAYILTVNTGSCLAKDTVMVRGSFPPEGNAGPDKTVCLTRGGRIGTTALPYHYYSWTSNPVGFTSNDANVYVTPTENTTYYLTISNYTGCPKLDTVVVSVVDIPVANAGPDKISCLGSATGFQIGTPRIGNYTYSWQSIPAGFTSTDPMPFVNPSVSTEYILYVNNNGCLESDVVTVSVYTAAAPAVTISASETNVCTGSTITFTASPSNVGPQPVYQWQVNGVNAGSNSTIFTTNTLKDNDQVKLLLTPNSPCATNSITSSNSITIRVTQPSAPAVSITSTSTKFCAGGSVTFTASPVNGGTTPLYQWKLNGVNVGTNSRTFTPANLSNGSQVQVSMVSNSNCALSATAVSNVITMTEVAPIVANAGPDKTICTYQSTTIGQTQTQGYSYNWQPHASLNNSSVALPTASPAVNTTYQLTVSTENGGCAAVDHVTVFVKSIPETPLITQTGNLLTSSALYGNQWYADGNLIPGATGQTFAITSGGTYTAKVTVDGCTSFSSNTITAVVTGVNDPTLDRNIRLAPNPVHDKLFIHYSGPPATFLMSVIDMSGEPVAKAEFTGSYEFDMKSLASGTYIIQLIHKQNRKQIHRLIMKL